MEQNLPVIAKKFWSIFRVVFFMLRKGISKRKLMVDLNVMLKRGKIAGAKAIGNLMSHNHHHHHGHHCSPPWQEYEFSCSNTPNYTFPSFLASSKKHKNQYTYHSHHHHNFFASTHAPPTHDDDMATESAVKVVLEMLNSNEMVVEASPMLPGFGKSPLVRQLRITDSPFPLQSVDGDDNGFVDKKAEEFIKKFYKDLRKQNKAN